MKAEKAPFSYLILYIFIFISVPIIPLNRADAAGGGIPDSLFLEHPYSVTGVSGTLEIVSVEGGGALIMNQLRADLNLYDNIFGLYAKFPFSGVTNGVFGNGEYDFGNIGLGTKYALLSSNNSAFTLGFEVLLPTTGNQLGALGARSYFRDFAYFTDDAYTFVPYGVFAIGGDVFALQANFDFDIMTNAKHANEAPFNTGGDNTELILKYGVTGSVTPHFNLPFSTSFLVELLMVSSTSFVNNVTGAYVTPGVRFGGRMYSFSAGVQIPFGSHEISDFANVDFIVNMMMKFGG
jgi:hypothetical protein